MKPNNITRAIIDATVDRSIREVDEDPNRSIRKLTDMGRHFASGRFLNQVYDVLQDLLRNEDSPYYTAIRNLLRNTALENMKGFGINIGYNSLTFGGKIIRDLTKKKPYSIPWCIVMRVDPSNPAGSSAEDLDHIVTQGNELGIYTYLVRCGGRMSSQNKLFETFARHNDSAFICLMPEGGLSGNQPELLRKCINTLFLFPAGAKKTAGNLQTIKQQKTLFGLYDFYGDDTVSEWLTRNRAEEFMAWDNAFAILVPEENCSCSTMKKMGAFAKHLRTKPKYPFILFDQRNDVMEIDKIVKDDTDPVYLEFLDNGTVLTRNDTVIQCRHTFSLEQILAEALPV